MTSTIPFTVEQRPDTGINNVMLGMWLFLASETMLFGGLFSAYVLLRSGSASWPSLDLSPARGIVITLALAAASIAVSAARRRSLEGDLSGAQRLLHAGSLLCVTFFGLKVWDWTTELAHGIHPASSTLAALYFLLTAVHAAHVLGGIGANVYAARRSVGAAMMANRISVVTLYWLFVDLVWLIIFVLFYL